MSDSPTDVTVLAAFAVGFVSFISPCVLPLVPGYLSVISGFSPTEATSTQHKARLISLSLAFCLSFTAVFVLLGLTATGLGSLLNDNRQLLNRVAGTLIVIMGTLFVLTPFVSALNRAWQSRTLLRKTSSGGPVVAGAAFAFAWTPCASPTLGAILTTAATQSSAGKGALLLACYSAGLAVPFLLSAVAFDRATHAFKWLRNHYTVITAISGAVLIAIGVLIFTDQMTRLNSEAEQLLSGLGLDSLWSR